MRIKSFSTTIFVLLTIVYCWNTSCDIIEDLSRSRIETPHQEIEKVDSNHAIVYFCGPKTRDYTSTPPGGGIVLVPVALGIIFVWWLVMNVFGKINDAVESSEKEHEKNEDLLKISEGKYTKIGSVKNGIQLVQLSPNKYAYIGVTGKPIIKEIFTKAEEFNYTSAIVAKNDGYALLKYDGSYLIHFGVASWIYAVGKCLMVYNRNGERHPSNRQGKYIYPDDIKEVKIDDKGNYILYMYLSLLPDKKQEVVIDENGKIITPLHNFGEQPEKLNNQVGVYHANVLCGLINLQSNEFLLDATKYKFQKIKYVPEKKQYIALTYNLGKNQPILYDYIFDEDIKFVAKELHIFT